MQFIENIKNDITGIQNLFSEDPLAGSAALLAILGGLAAIFYFVIIKQVLPIAKGAGGPPLESKQSRLAVLALATFGIFSFVFQNSVILRILIVVPIFYAAWIIETESDDDNKG